jgi:endonuclease YncB( thermonuclease family)
MKKKLFYLLLITAIAIPSTGYCWMCRYVKAISGDTLVINCSGSEHIVRLYGIDAPDIGSINHEKSRKFLDQIMKEKTSYVVGQPAEKEFFDEYGRHVAVIDKDGICINEKMIQSGMAFVYTDNCRYPVCERWKRLEQIALQQPTSIAFIEEEKPWVLRDRKSYLAASKSGYFEDIFYSRENVKTKTKSGKVVNSIKTTAFDTAIPRDRYFYIPEPPAPNITYKHYEFH